MKGILVVGSNFGNREENVHKALMFIQSCCSVVSCSDVYESPDNFGHGNHYLNLVIEINCNVSELVLNNQLKQHEIQAGRNKIRRERGEVPIDIDIVVWEGEIRRIHDFQAKYFQQGYNQIRKEQKVKNT